MIDYTLTPKQLQESLRVLSCASEEDLKEIFGETLGRHLHAKFFNWSNEPSKFIMSLDNDNLHVLCQYLADRTRALK